ncbi:MAG: hypothetical protein NT096_00225 [Proteobacteria bacterium]|nr:hypothetical protein [Pseudomonadota bacterium]
MKVFTAGRMFFLDTGDRQCVFRVDHIRSKNKVIDVTLLAKDHEKPIKLIEWGSLRIEELRSIRTKEFKGECHEIFRKDLPLYVGMKCLSNEFTKILRGNHVQTR